VERRQLFPLGLVFRRFVLRWIFLNQMTKPAPPCSNRFKLPLNPLFLGGLGITYEKK
jgi:hypothetical protein